MISCFFTKRRIIAFIGAFTIGVVVAAPARTSDKILTAIAKDGNYKVGNCNVVVNHFESEPSRVGIGVIKYSQTDDSAQSYVEYDSKTQEGSCVFFMADRFKAKVEVHEDASFKTVVLKCGGLLSAEEGTARFTVEKKTGKVFAASQNLRYARYSNPQFSFPLIKDEAPALNCRAEPGEVMVGDATRGTASTN